MKLHRLALLAVFLVGSASSQTNTSPFPSSGFVGIGTISPLTPLHVVGPITAGYDNSTWGVDYLYGAYGSEKLFTIGSQYSSGASFLGFAVKSKHLAEGYDSSTGINIGRSSIEADSNAIKFFTGSPQQSTDGGTVLLSEKMRIAGGNVGIGTTSPTHPLHVEKSSSNAVAYFNNSGGWSGSEYSVQATGYSDFNGLRLNGQDGHRSIYSESALGIGTINRPITFDTQLGQEMMRITPSGNVGIGTTNPQHKLAVNGTIKAKEVIVETTGWSDYVFADNYRLAPLSEVEAHIAEKKHLPGIPSAAEVTENGVNVAQVQAALLAKVEELTLHLISQEKSLRELKAENEALKTRMATYEQR